MKEYIAKEDLFYLLNEKRIPFNAEINNALLTISTVTKADICREFAEILKKQLNPYSGNYGLGFCYEKMCKRFDELIAEIENKE